MQKTRGKRQETIIHLKGNHTYSVHQAKVSLSKQHAGYELTMLRHMSVIQAARRLRVSDAPPCVHHAAARKLRVSVTSPFVKHAAACRLCVAPCLYARDRPPPGISVIYGGRLGIGSAHANINILSRKLDQPETWHPEIDQALQTTGFYQLSRVGVIRGHSTMLAAFVERWQLKTLEDVLHIFSLPIDGEVVTGWTNSSHDFLVTQSLAIFGSKPEVDSFSKSYINLSWIRHIRNTQPLDTWESVMCYIRCHIFCLLGITLFVDKSTAYAHAKYLPLFYNFDKIGNYSWGLACLAHLYMSLCHASRYDCKEMDDPLDLLFAWAWERMPWLAPIPRSYASPHSCNLL
ncbi:hypothetical protein Ahy_A04g020858 [Arachis hypogaea]|uniref:Aminotransferase-like plant mobile domain-containing protein n=1 Tax=Arachis hypogaea TaxID=3818 RepID=A0A445DIS2_ARAHY|nr:hypothetical protein Ahy_A04g020858 [Arachis hypogaea]